jgi:hypothetical protein
VKIDFMGSRELIVSPIAGEVIELACRGHGSASAIFNTIFRRNSYLELQTITSEEGEKLARITKKREPPTPRNIANDLP